MFNDAPFSLRIVATVERLRLSDLPMFVGVSPFLDRLIMSNFTFMLMAFLFFDALTPETSVLLFEFITKGKKFK